MDTSRTLTQDDEDDDDDSFAIVCKRCGTVLSSMENFQKHKTSGHCKSRQDMQAIFDNQKVPVIPPASAPPPPPPPPDPEPAIQVLDITSMPKCQGRRRSNRCNSGQDIQVTFDNRKATPAVPPPLPDPEPTIQKSQGMRSTIPQVQKPKNSVHCKIRQAIEKLFDNQETPLPATTVPPSVKNHPTIITDPKLTIQKTQAVITINSSNHKPSGAESSAHHKSKQGIQKLFPNREEQTTPASVMPPPAPPAPLHNSEPTIWKTRIKSEKYESASVFTTPKVVFPFNKKIGASTSSSRIPTPISRISGISNEFLIPCIRLTRLPDTPKVINLTPGPAPLIAPAPARTPLIAPARTPLIAPARTPLIVPARTPLIAPARTPLIAPASAPLIAPASAPLIAPAPTPLIALALTPVIVSAPASAPRNPISTRRYSIPMPTKASIPTTARISTSITQNYENPTTVPASAADFLAQLSAPFLLNSSNCPPTNMKSHFPDPISTNFASIFSPSSPGELDMDEMELKSSPINSSPHSLEVNSVSGPGPKNKSGGKPRKKRRALTGYKCTHCPKIFNQKSARTHHEFRHTRPFQCPQCPKGWPSQSALQLHVTRIHDTVKVKILPEFPPAPKIYSCDQCPFTSRDYGSVWGHKKHHGTQHSHKCGSCTCTFVSSNGLTRHINRVHPELRQEVQAKLKGHVKIVNEGDFLVCTLCSKTIHSLRMTAHRKLYHPEVKPYYCVQCPYATRSQAELWRHRKAHKIPNLFNCLYCTASYSTILRANFHIRKDHPNEAVIPRPRPLPNGPSSSSSIVGKGKVKEKVAKEKKEPRQFNCTLCTKVFWHQSDLHRHVGTHTKPFHCIECPRRFPDKYTLKYHMKQGHGSKRLTTLQRRINAKKRVYAGQVAKPKPCPVCGLEIAGSTLHAQHYKIYHPNYKAHKCAHCPYSTASQNSLTSHSAIHKGSNIFNCAYCTGSFFTLGARDKHIQSVHPGMSSEIPEENLASRRASAHPTGYYKLIEESESEREPGMEQTCRICNEILKSRNALEVHFTKTHPDQKPYKCDDCPYQSMSYYSLSAHEKIHSEKNDIKCDFCSAMFGDQRRKIYHEQRLHKDELAAAAAAEAAAREQEQRQPEEIEEDCKLNFGVLKSEAEMIVPDTEMDSEDFVMTEKIEMAARPEYGYACPLCYKTFPIQIALNMHMRRFHTSTD